MNNIAKLLALWIVLQVFFFDINAPDIGFRPDRLVFVLIVVLFVIYVMGKRIKVSRIGKIEVLMIFFTLIATLSLINSGANADTSHGENKWLNALFNVTYFPFITYFIAKNMDYSRERAKTILTTICILGVYLSLIGMFEHFQINALIWPRYIVDSRVGVHFGRVRGPFHDSVTMGRILVMGFLCIVFMASQYKDTRRPLFYGIATITAGTIYFTYTRGPWVGFAAALMVLIFLRNRMRGFVILFLFVALLIGVSGMGSKFSLTESTLFSQRQNTVNDRIVSYTIAMKMGQDHALFGVGFGNFGLKWDDYFENMNQDISFSGFDGSHNTYLAIFSEMGIAALLIYCGILYNLGKMCLLTYKKMRTRISFESNFVVIVMAMAAMYVFTGIFSDLRWNLLQNNLIFLFFGMIGSLASRIRDDALCAEPLTGAATGEEMMKSSVYRTVRISNGYQW